ILQDTEPEIVEKQDLHGSSHAIFINGTRLVPRTGPRVKPRLADRGATALAGAASDVCRMIVHRAVGERDAVLRQEAKNFFRRGKRADWQIMVPGAAAACVFDQ